MRADRLLALLMLLQTRGRLTAQQLANELGVSERTIYRDIEALSLTGVPVYGQAGPQGGYALVDKYRTSLTGLTNDEVQALFMLSIPAPLQALGVSQALHSALLKLTAALPEARQKDKERVRERFLLDAAWWQQGADAVPHLQTVQQAVWQDRCLRLTFRPLPTLTMEQEVAPYGLVAKAGIWFVVVCANGRFRVHRISTLLDVAMTDTAFTRVPTFDLAAFWPHWCAEREQLQFSYRVLVRVEPEFIPLLPRVFGPAQSAPPGVPDAAGRLTLELAFGSLEEARQRLLGFGRAVEVLHPPPLRRTVLDFARQTVKLYAKTEDEAERP